MYTLDLELVKLRLDGDNKSMTQTEKKPKKKQKGSYQHGDLKESLLRAAFLTIKKTTEVHFSLRSLAKSVGVTPMAAYRHFPSKESILLEIARDGFGKLSQRFESVLKKDPSDLQAIGIAYVEFALENPVYFKVMFHPDLQGRSKNKKNLLKPRPEDERAYQLLLNCVSINQQKGRFKNKDTEALAITAWSTVHGLATLLVNGNLDSKYCSDLKLSRKVIEQTTALSIQGLKN
ncbi:MAG: TetR/AcrR family transcriptional regulator [Proteobacteria bacterium]|jgi:AcrR family transcriptional regulator|nr:TetR/AcrR family transcriptional regulator [Pseudomonadota bacterium]